MDAWGDSPPPRLHHEGRAARLHLHHASRTTLVCQQSQDPRLTVSVVMPVATDLDSTVERASTLSALERTATSKPAHRSCAGATHTRTRTRTCKPAVLGQHGGMALHVGWGVACGGCPLHLLRSQLLAQPLHLLLHPGPGGHRPGGGEGVEGGVGSKGLMGSMPAFRLSR
jgi:hypothetical protein